MPFGVAWTDSLAEDTFLGYHHGLLGSWSQDDWNLDLVVFHDGAPIGCQSLSGEDFARVRRVVTGSWLGRDWQGRGLGTEMRAAVLTLAFDALGAENARTGYVAGNPQSEGVSRKLGYELVGSHTVAPRGVPIEHADLELRADAFESPVPVEISGLARLLPLFGVRE
jgi:RimJ/RimL family protein N-acetyltransferase